MPDKGHIQVRTLPPRKHVGLGGQRVEQFDEEHDATCAVSMDMPGKKRISRRDPGKNNNLPTLCRAPRVLFGIIRRRKVPYYHPPYLIVETRGWGRYGSSLNLLWPAPEVLLRKG